MTESEDARSAVPDAARMLDALGEAVVATDERHRIVYWNRAAEWLFGWPAEEALGRLDSEVLRAHATPEQTAEIIARLAAGQTWSGDYEVAHRDGSLLPVHVTGSPMFSAEGAPVGYVSVVTDLTRVRQLEQRLHEAERLEAIGRFAGGVAHDFNNLLTGISTAAHLLLDDLGPNDGMRGEVDAIRAAAERAAELTSRLLAFGRARVLQPEVIDAKRWIASLLPALDEIVGPDIDLQFDSDATPLHVRADTSELGHAIKGLAANARDAMPEGGQLTIRLRADDVSDARAGRISAEMRAGRYVGIEMTDSGSGIEPEELGKVFEPFYTTRSAGGHVGLGLSTTYGIVSQSDGFIGVESRPGAGSRFTIYLPPATPERSVRGPAPASLETAQVSVGPTVETRAPGPETLLLVDDEAPIRRLARKVLERKGFAVEEAGDGVEALDRVRDQDRVFDIVVSDVRMPRMGGAELASRIEREQPATPVLLMSGYADDEAVRREITATGRPFLAKPFTPDQLARKVRSVIDASRARR